MSKQHDMSYTTNQYFIQFPTISTIDCRLLAMGANCSLLIHCRLVATRLATDRINGQTDRQTDCYNPLVHVR